MRKQGGTRVCMWANGVGGMREQDDEAQKDLFILDLTQRVRLDKEK